MNEVARIEPQGREPQALSGEVVSRPSGALAQTDAQRAIAEVQAAMMIARANPRDEKQAIDRILNACQRQRLAEAAVYSYSRGGSEISGPSIRLAEALAQNWGNIQFGIREIEQRAGVESTVQAFAWDVETNVKREMVFTVPHVRHTRKGSYKLDDPRDVYEMVANNGSRRLRACILAVIPGDVIDMAVEQCEATMRVKADVSPEGIQKMVAAFEELGVTQHQLETRIQRRLDAIQPAQVVNLKKIYASLRDGMSQVADWFEPIETDDAPEATTGNAGAKAALKAAAKPKAEKAKATEPEPEDQRTDTDEAPAEINDTTADEHPAQAKVDQIIAEMNDPACNAVMDVNRVLTKYANDIGAMPDEFGVKVEIAADKRRQEIRAAQQRQTAEEPAE